jgi:hypothetical protein
MMLVAHCFFGLNFINMWPPFIGVLVYCIVMKKKIADNIHVAFFATALAPFISELLFRYPVGNFDPSVSKFNWVGLIIALVCGMAVGFILLPLFPGTNAMHRGYNLYKANVRGSVDVIPELYPRIKKEFGDIFNVTTSAKTMVEITPIGISKASMLVDIKEKMLDKDTVLCTVGDYDNDLEMHAISDLSVCPSNANDAVKSVCKLQLCSNDDGVIADLVEYFDKNG